MTTTTTCRAPENILESAGVNAADGCGFAGVSAQAARANGEGSPRPLGHKDTDMK